MRDLRISIENSQVLLKQKEAALIQNQGYAAKLETALQEQKSVADRATKMMDALHFQVYINILTGDTHTLLADSLRTSFECVLSIESPNPTQGSKSYLSFRAVCVCKSEPIS